ncbi:MAG: cation-transporting P-type ATPase, partial [Cyanobacteria bacterium J06560_2]
MTVSIDRISSSSPASDRAALSREWYRLSPQQSADVLKSHLKIGLTIAEAHRRQLQFGSNQLTPQH